MKFTLSFLPFKYVLKWLGRANEKSELAAHPESLKLRSDIKRAIFLCDRYTFWKTECYTQALTAKILLKQLGLSSTVYIGFCKEKEGTYKGHAWLRSFDMVVTGGKEKEEFDIQSFFT